MKIISYKEKKENNFGIMLSESSFLEISKYLKIKDLKDFIKKFSIYKNEIKNLKINLINEKKLSDCNIISPIPKPTSLRDAYAFKQHVETSRKNRGLSMIDEFDNFPVYYYSNHNSVKGPGTIQINRKLSKMLDYELEIAAIIGKEGINISAENADEYIFGFTIMNDFSSRDIQMDEMKLNLGPAKGKDFATSLGPYILTTNEISDRIIKTKNGNRYDIDLRGYLNGKLISHDNLKNMSWTFAQIIERISSGTYIYPGDVIGSGTCATGCLYEINSYPNAEKYWLQDGDIIDIKADKLGCLKNIIKII